MGAWLTSVACASSVACGVASVPVTVAFNWPCHVWGDRVADP